MLKSSEFALLERLGMRSSHRPLGISIIAIAATQVAAALITVKS